MANEKIIIIKDYFGIKNYIAITRPKEIFVNGYFIERKEILLVSEKLNNRISTTMYPIVNTIIEEVSSIDDYIKNNNVTIEIINKYLKEKNKLVSLLQLLQINEIYKDIQEVERSFYLLAKVYEKILPPEEPLSFMDF